MLVSLSKDFNLKEEHPALQSVDDASPVADEADAATWDLVGALDTIVERAIDQAIADEASPAKIDRAEERRASAQNAVDAGAPLVAITRLLRAWEAATKYLRP